MLRAFLDYHRATLAMKCDGLSDEDLRRRSMPPSGLSLLGLVRHMAEVERNWFRRVINGEDMDVFIHWQGQWKHSPNEAGIRDRGHGMLRWTGVQSILLTGTEGDLPFGMAVRHVVPPARSAPTS